MQLDQIAINSVSTRQDSLEEALAAYAGAGFQHVEFVLPLVKNWLAAGHSVADARQLLQRHGLHAIGGFETGVNCFGTPDDQRANHAIHVANAQLIHDLGGGTLVVGTDGPTQPTPDTLDQMAAGFRQLAEQLVGLNVKIAIEFNWSPIIKSLNSAVLLCQKVDHPQVGVLFDPAHYYVTSTKFADINARTVPWITHVHMDDMSDKPGDLSHCNDDRVLPGEGVLNLPALIGALEQHGYHGFFSIEMFSAELWGLSAAEAAQRCYRSMAQLAR